MAVADQKITDEYAIYCGDSIEVMSALPDASVHLSVYSPPFAGLYIYSSDERDLSNSRDYAEFFDHYDYVVRELHRITLPGRMTAVHCMDVPTGNTGRDALSDFPTRVGLCGAVSRLEGAADRPQSHDGQEPGPPNDR